MNVDGEFAQAVAGGMKARRIAILVADGAGSRSLDALARELVAAGAVPRFVGSSVR